MNQNEAGEAYITLGKIIQDPESTQMDIAEAAGKVGLTMEVKLVPKPKEEKPKPLTHENCDQCGTSHDQSIPEKPGIRIDIIMGLEDIIQECARTAKSKGFNLTQPATQVALIATEVAEALECVSTPQREVTPALARFITTLHQASTEFETYRRSIPPDYYYDRSCLSNSDAYTRHCRELADICVRVFSYVGGMQMTEEFLQALKFVMDNNRTRPEKHGKGF